MGKGGRGLGVVMGEQVPSRYNPFNKEGGTHEQENIDHPVVRLVLCFPIFPCRLSGPYPWLDRSERVFVRLL